MILHPADSFSRRRNRPAPAARFAFDSRPTHGLNLLGRWLLAPCRGIGRVLEDPDSRKIILEGLSMSATEGVFGRVTKVLMESLNVEEDQVTPLASLRNDLGAESIDFLDIVFRLEREFGIKIPRDELFPESVFQGDPEFVNEGMVTDKGMAELRLRMPYADVAGLEGDRRLSGLPDLFTVDLVARYVAWKLSTPSESGMPCCPTT
jgi:acyl carrier protein